MLGTEHNQNWWQSPLGNILVTVSFGQHPSYQVLNAQHSLPVVNTATCGHTYNAIQPATATMLIDQPSQQVLNAHKGRERPISCTWDCSLSAKVNIRRQLRIQGHGWRLRRT